MPIGATIGAAGSLAGAAIGAYGSESAAKTQASALSQGLQVQQGMFNTANAALSPYYTAGQSVLPTLQSLLTPGASQTSTLSQLPGFQFQSQWGTTAAKNNLAAMGLGGSAGPLATAISQYNQGLAGTSFNNLVSQLQGFANTGAGAAGALSSAAINSGNAQASTLGSIGAAQASGTLGATNAISGGVTGAVNAATLPYLLNSIQGNTGVYGNSLFNSPNYGGGGILTGDVYGGSAANPLPGLSAADYG